MGACVIAASCGDSGSSDGSDTVSDTESSDTDDTVDADTFNPTTATTSGSMTASDSDPSAGPDSNTESASDSTTSGETGDTTGQGIVEFSDEFDDPATLDDWIRRHEAEGTEAQYTTLDIGQTTSGQLTIIPVTSGWFNEFDGPFLYKLVEGDFIVETSVEAESRQSPGEPPMNLYNSAGLMVRSPDHGPGSENWVIHNVGRQSLEVGVATEGKNTTDSTSMLQLVPGTNAGRLRICRVGATVILARMLTDENQFTETHRYTRGDLFGEVQVGMMVNGWNSNGGQPDFELEADVVGRFDYVRMWQPTSEADCFAEL